MSGRLIYLMGSSGSGKDSVLSSAREHLAARGCRIVQRVITRSAEALGEDAIGISLAEFEQLEQAGAFAMSWRANGLAYGIPRQIDDWLMAGQDVLVNGSRAYLGEARRRYPTLQALLLTVDPAVLRRRLLARGRETPAQVEARLARNGQFVGGMAAEIERLHQLDNSGQLQLTVDKLLGLLGTRC